jgi:hypothetical protein
MGYYGNQPATGENNSFRVLDDLSSYTLTFDGSSAGVVSTVNDTLTFLNHRFVTGQRVTYNDGGGTAIGGLSDGVYYIVKNDQNTIKLAPTYADAVASTNLEDLTSLGVGSSHTLNVAFDGVNTRFVATYGGGRKLSVTRAAQLQISINGVIQQPQDTKTPTAGFGVDADSVIVFSTAPDSTDVFWGNAVANNFPTFDIADNTVDTFEGDGATVDFTLSKAPVNNDNILVTLDGVVQYPSDATNIRAYSVTANVLTFTGAPGNGVDIQVRHIGFAGATSSAVTGFYGRTGNASLTTEDHVTMGSIVNVGSINSSGIVTATSVHVGAGISVVGISTIANTVVGGGTTELIVNGDARITGILTIGTASVTIDGTNNTITASSFVGNVTGDVTGSLKSTASLAGISSEISDTAVDIFVYDTRKDSDGGAWRKRTQHTSWYNETLNTATRGSRKEFPAVAVIVLGSDFITIYDGDDPDMPMWMKFISNTTGGNSGGSHFVWSPCTLSSIVCKNGLMGWSDNGSAAGWYEANFISEKVIRRESGSLFARWGGNFSQRNGGSTFLTASSLDVGGIVNWYANDSAMTVLPNAPIDDATGLPIPTIAVATGGGVSVIKDDGTVVDLTRSSGNQTTSYVDFNGDELIIQNSATTGTYYNVAIPSSDTANDDYNGNVFWAGGTPASRLQYGASEILSKKSYELVRSYNVGFDILRDYNLATKGLVAYATTSYNTGWMHGNIKGAFLSDTDATNVTGAELVTNGTFASALGSEWTLVTGSQGGTITVNGSNQLVITQGSNSAAMYATQPVTTVVGKRYVANVDVISTTEANYFRMWIGTSANASNLGTTGTLTTAGNYSVYFTATSTTTYITLNSDQNATRVTTWDNASVRLDAEPDRSVNNKGLQVFGTVTKSAVATGAELVAYSGFNTTLNYLEQPYNSDLTFGTSDFSVTCWYYNDTSTEIRIQRTTGGADGWAITLGNAGEDFYIHNGNFSTYAPFTDLSTAGAWIHFTVVRIYGDKWYVYKNGELAVSTTTLASNNFNDTGTFKVHAASGSSANSIALLRVSQSVPSAEQIKKIYEDEKVLFQENASCTLYGSSDAVTALAYDEDLQLLHVGTSSGRSDFQGLRRINNTTTAVTTAISASNGLVAEQ